MMRLALSAFLILAFATVGSAATISDISGSVLVDQGNGFKAVKTTSDIPVGSRVLVTRGGNAVIAFDEGCKKTLSANSITTVAPSRNCEPTAQVAAQGWFFSFLGFFSNPASIFSALGALGSTTLISVVVIVPVVAGALSAVFVGVSQANNPINPVPPLSR